MSSSIPPLTTIYFTDLSFSSSGGDDPSSVPLIGIDSQTFNVNQTFRGMKLIPPGLHIIHFAQTSSSVKYGICLFTSRQLLLSRYNSQIEDFELRSVDDQQQFEMMTESLGHDYNFMVGYNSIMTDDRCVSWSVLTDHITASILDKVIVLPRGATKRLGWKVCTVTSSTEENKILLSELKRTTPDTDYSTLIDDSESLFNFPAIETKITYRPNATDSEKTTDCLDKSWYFENIVLSTSGFKHLQEFFGQFQFCYLMVWLFGNYAAARQYNNMLKVYSDSKQFISDKPTDLRKFLMLLEQQFTLISEEYFNFDTDMIDVRNVIGAIKSFQSIISELGDKKTYMKRSLNEDLMKVKNVLIDRFEDINEDSFEVPQDFEDNENYLKNLDGSLQYYIDEDDEDAPVVVTGIEWDEC
ncbi:U5 snRNP complex subunit [Saccharomycopsis crataegensis]|uniref:U5 snRNP complex subunit n=1 Tax=Saccharomycopsis crataegensis TaxID=43959 RepID=A0AAV5QJF9_9ASCO|nr:U5 snRNP complex subunit [Saccharomycopsis crataegensis]